MDRYNLGAALKLVGLGWYVAICIVAGLSVGLWLDERVFHTSFWFTITGLLIGLLVAFWGLYKALKAILGNHGE